MKQKVSVPFGSTEYSSLKSPKVKRRNRIILWRTLLVISILLKLAFVGVFVVIPVAFMLSKDFQTSMVLPRWAISESNFSDFKRHRLEGARNFYVTLKNNITLGVWHILPESLIGLSRVASFNTLLFNSTIPVLLYFHGNARVRSGSTDIYKIQRKLFHVISFDYRGYGDSTDAELTDTNIVNDCMLMYQWLLERTKSEIFVWGHSLGTGVATITLERLNSMGIQPKGLVLETPFTSSRDVIINSKIGKIYSWTPWFESTILKPIEENKLGFNVIGSITKVDCPIMFLHAKDDDVIPYKLGKKLYEIVESHRGSVNPKLIFHSFPEESKYGHVLIWKEPNLLEYIREFMLLCDEKS